LCDSDDSVDEIAYELTPSAAKFLGDPNSPAYTSPFVQTFSTNFITPQSLLECSRPRVDATPGKDIMSEHLEESDEDMTNDARHFMKHMNAQSYSCAEAFPLVTGLDSTMQPVRFLDVGGGSGILL